MARFGEPCMTTNASCNATDPSGTSPRPLSEHTPHAAAAHGRRRSASTRQVRWYWAKASARFTATVVLPSLGSEDVTNTACGYPIGFPRACLSGRADNRVRFSDLSRLDKLSVNFTARDLGGTP